MKRELGVSTVYVARSVVQHVGKDPRNFLVYMESYVGAFGPSGRGCLPGCLEGGQKCPQNVRSVPFLVTAAAAIDE